MGLLVSNCGDPCGCGDNCQNYQGGSGSTSLPGINPWQGTYNPVSPPLNPPASCTPILLLISPTPFFNPTPASPWIYVANSLIRDNTVDWTFTVTYDGTTILSYSGTTTFPHQASTELYFPSAGWVLNPTGQPGYNPNPGDQAWVYLYSGPVSSNPNPIVTQTFTMVSGSDEFDLEVTEPFQVVFMEP